MKYTCINIQGNLVSEEILQKIEAGTADGQTAEKFGLEKTANLKSEIEYAWSRVKLDWKYFSDRMDDLPATDPYGTGMARRWMKSFFGTLGFELKDQRAALTGDNGKTYAISNTADNLDELPVHIVNFHDPAHPDRNTLDAKSSGGTSRMSPHATMQEYLNVTEHVYGMATNGLYLRLVRDSGRLVKLTYLEFDLKRLMEEDRYSEFTVLYRLLHSSRFPRSRQEADQCLLESYYKESIETGNRIRNGLSKAVQQSLESLGRGFLQHEENTLLREQLSSGKLTPKDFYRQLLRLIYRFLFLMVTEERDLVYDPENKNPDVLRKKRIYQQYYSIARLRQMSRLRYLYEARYNDLWQGLVQTFQLFDEMGAGRKMGIEPLAGDLFNSHALPTLEQSLISNALLLECVRNMNEFVDEQKNLVPINYRSLDVEELGSVYEGLLELHPVIENLEAANPQYINFTFHAGTDRKTTGSYYTRPDLVNELIKSALIPVISDRLNEHKDNKDARIKALLSLKVCDAAAGSGHMLLAAARTIAWYLARERSGEENPPPPVYRASLRDTIQHCVYAVDMNPDAVELCKLALWLEGHNSGKPLSFLDHKIRNGNSLVGVTDLSVLTRGIPDDAFNPVTGDDKELCKKLKKLNATFNKTRQADLFDQGAAALPDAHVFSDEYHELDDIKQDDVAAVAKAKQKYDHLRNDANWYKEWRACNLWTAAFFYTYTEETEQAAPSSERLQKYLQNPAAAYGPMIGKADALAAEHKFFHWPLEFPDVWEQGGFDVMLGNPPWEKINLEDIEFFETRDVTISQISKSSDRIKAIRRLQQTNPNLFEEYNVALNKTNKTINFLKCSIIFEYGNQGLLNTYALFTELILRITNNKGAAGVIIPSGFFGDDTISPLFRHSLTSNFIEVILDFENSLSIFKSVHKSYRFAIVVFNKANANKKNKGFKALFYLKEPPQSNNRNFLTITLDDLKRLNPNNFVCPSFRSAFEYELNKKIYNYGVLINNQSKNKDVEIHRMINISTDSGLLFDEENLTSLPLYESKLLHSYDHRYSTFQGADKLQKNKGNTRSISEVEKRDSSVKVTPRLFGERTLVEEKNQKWQWEHNWFLVYRCITRSTDERTSIAAIVPKSVVSNSAFIIFIRSANEALVELTLLNSIPFDFVARAKVNLNFPPVILAQTPSIRISDMSLGFRKLIISIGLELTYTSWDIKAFADDVWKEADEELRAAIQQQWEANKAATGGHEWAPPEWCEIDEAGCPLPPFKWDEDRRAVLKAELDAIYAHLYGLTTEELRYILDPQDVYGPDFPGETFRVLKEKEIRNYGEYRTRRLVLEAWERMGYGN
ncbi:MAG: hypothetical protein KF744_17565 [Taibaiella sp.]|nr:hypothetical protein [Taibaiella sp.]